MTKRRWFWLFFALLNAAGIWRWLVTPGIEVFWLIVWGISFVTCFEAFISDRSLMFDKEKHHGNH